MRTRFLNTDYFSSSSSPLETLNFLNLPVPHLSPSRLFTCKDDLLRFDSFFDFSLEIEQLSIHSAFSKFFSEVIPQIIDVDCREFESLRSPIRKGCDDEKESDILCEEKEEESRRTFGSETLEKENETAVGCNKTQSFEVIHFETPEPAVFLENVFIFDKEEILVHSGGPEIENYLDMLRPGLAIQYSNEIRESLYSVEDIALDYLVEQKTFISEDAGSLPDQRLLQCCTFPLLEVDEIGLGILTSQSMEDELLSVLENIEQQPKTQKDNLLVSGEEILGSVDYDILDSLSDISSSKQYLESELASMDIFHKMDFISMVESSQLQEKFEFHPVMASGDFLLPISPVVFQEFEIFDMDSSIFYEVFFNIQKTDEPVTGGWMFREDMNFKNFNELIITHELALIDETFKSLPIPVLSDHDKIESIYTVMEEKLAELKPQPLSASDEIYLDWHLLEGDKCNGKLFCCHHTLLEEADSSIEFDIVSSNGEKLVYDFIFSDDALIGPNMEECAESLHINYDGVSVLDDHLMGVALGKLLDNGSPKAGNMEQSGEENTDKASRLFKSMSQFNDLDFFLNPRKAITGQKGETAVMESDTIAPCSKLLSASVSTSIQLQQWDITLHKVKLSGNILSLIDIFEKSYLAITENETELNSFAAPDNFKLLSLSKQLLMDSINNSMLQKGSCHVDENTMAFVTLYAIKQLACYTCFYGIHTARLYVDKLCKNLGCMKSRLGSLQSFIVDADGKVDEEITRAHPALLVIQGILHSNTSQSNLKVLILAEQAFWWSLKRLVMSMELSCNELQTFYTRVDQPDALHDSGFTNSKMDDLLNSDCLLASHELVSASFPFNKFGLILEYGGSFGSSRISSLSPKLAGLPCLHFLKVELGNSSASRALCEGVDMPQNIEGGEESHSILTLNENISAQQLLELLNFVPVENRYHTRSGEASSVPFSQLAMDSEQIQQSIVSYPDTIIIVNTQNIDKEMIVSRRSTYQKILAMEKEGIQVVERDSDLPVDIIISSAICLVWYDSGNIGRKSTALDEASSCLPLCVENIATNVLTLLSFTFSACILVFEGEINFISTVMEFSDGLYAAAASLGLDLQLFWSYSSELTDEIIFSCIGHPIKLTRGLYPKMPESETLAESFLTKFPSVNPLTAHAMLSSIGTLIEFLQLSHERRISAIQKYNVPYESISLFSTLCKYGERDDSKSIMTDCSSSVSSGPDSDKCHLNIDSERKQLKCTFNPHKPDIHVDDLMHFEPSNQFTDSILNPSGASKPYDSWKDNEIFGDYEKPSSSLNDLFGKNLDLDFDMKMKHSRVSKAYDCHILEGPHILNEIKDPNCSLKDTWLDQNEGSKITRMSNMGWHNIAKSSNQQEDFIGEVVDLTCSPIKGKEFYSVPKSSSSPSAPQMENNSIRKSKIARRLSFGKSSHPSFPTVTVVNSGSNIFSGKDLGQSFQGTNNHIDIDHQSAKEHRKNLLEEVLEQRFAGFKGRPFQEEMSHYSGTPLSNAIHSEKPQPGSPWTIEFLNRIREKSRLRQQSLPCETAAQCFGASGKISKVSKRRSPSILEFFKYQGGSMTGNLPEQKKQKRYTQSLSSSKNKIPSTSFLPTWTPIDKRARQTLSFATNESGSQTKLVWGDGSAHDQRKKFRDQ